MLSGLVGLLSTSRSAPDQLAPGRERDALGATHGGGGLAGWEWMPGRGGLAGVRSAASLFRASRGAEGVTRCRAHRSALPPTLIFSGWVGQGWEGLASWTGRGGELSPVPCLPGSPGLASTTARRGVGEGVGGCQTGVLAVAPDLPHAGARLLLSGRVGAEPDLPSVSRPRPCRQGLSAARRCKPFPRPQEARWPLLRTPQPAPHQRRQRGQDDRNGQAGGVCFSRSRRPEAAGDEVGGRQPGPTPSRPPPRRGQARGGTLRVVPGPDLLPLPPPATPPLPASLPRRARSARPESRTSYQPHTDLGSVLPARLTVQAVTLARLSRPRKGLSSTP